MSSSQPSPEPTGATSSRPTDSPAPTPSAIKSEPPPIYYMAYFHFNEKGHLCGGPKLTRDTTVIVEQRRTFRLISRADLQKDSDANCFGDVTHNRLFQSEDGTMYRGYVISEAGEVTSRVVTFEAVKK